MRPPLRLTSLDIVEGARLSCLAISRIDNCDEISQEISSRSWAVKGDGALFLAGCLIPPVLTNIPCMLEWPLSKNFAISC
jgi:hypothetical protein